MVLKNPSYMLLPTPSICLGLSISKFLKGTLRHLLKFTANMSLVQTYCNGMDNLITQWEHSHNRYLLRNSTNTVGPPCKVCVGDKLFVP